jgi:hypothetical protein
MPRPATPTRLNKVGIHLHRQFTYSTCWRQGEEQDYEQYLHEELKTRDGRSAVGLPVESDLRTRQRFWSDYGQL